MKICSCSPGVQLLSRGLFPCAPFEPSLAVDINMLDFVQHLFVRAAPNVTAWSDTVETFLSNHNYHLPIRVSHCILFYNIACSELS